VTFFASSMLSKNQLHCTTCCRYITSPAGEKTLFRAVLREVDQLEVERGRVALRKFPVVHHVVAVDVEDVLQGRMDSSMASRLRAQEELEMPWRKTLPPKRTEGITFIAKVDTLDTDTLEDGTPQYEATWTVEAGQNCNPAHITVTWDDVKRRGAPHPGQRWRIKMEPID
jgi:hypothetical protein